MRTCGRTGCAGINASKPQTVGGYGAPRRPTTAFLHDQDPIPRDFLQTVARVAHDAINTIRHQRVPRLDGDEPAEPIAKSRSAPPAAKRKTPSQRSLSPSRVQNPIRSV
jgi:hypothetical protein